MSSDSDNEDIIFATDFYEMTMSAAYYYLFKRSKKPSHDRRGVFEMFIRKLPRNRSYLVVAGLEQILYFLSHIKFNDSQILFLKSLDVFKSIGEDFFQYLKNFRFTGNVWAVPEGTILFPYEPLIRIEAPLIEGQIVETYILSMLNYQSLVASKASRIVSAAMGKPIVEFGSRRAHGPQAGVLAARASYLAGCCGTSNLLAGQKLGIPLFGTMAHSFIMCFEREEEAFREFIKLFPTGYLLVDTYDSPAAIQKIIKSHIIVEGIRLDSGEPHSCSVQARNLLDRSPKSSYASTKIMYSGDLNEFAIRDLVNRGSPIDSFGVGTELSTSKDDPVMNGVYKLVAIEVPSLSKGNNLSAVKRKEVIFKLKTSISKKSYPGPKQVHRIIDNGLLKKDVIALADEEYPVPESIPLLQNVMEKGRLVSSLPSIHEIKEFHLRQVKTLPSAYFDLDFRPKSFPVCFSEKIETLVKNFVPR